MLCRHFWPPHKATPVAGGLKASPGGVGTPGPGRDGGLGAGPPGGGGGRRGPAGGGGGAVVAVWRWQCGGGSEVVAGGSAVVAVAVPAASRRRGGRQRGRPAPRGGWVGDHDPHA